MHFVATIAAPPFHCYAVLVRRLSSALAVLLMTSALCAQSSTAKNGPRIAVTFAAGIPSESVSIEYYLRGPFGARGNAVSPKPGVHSYEIDTSYNGVPAESIKLLVYVPGCEFAIFDVPTVGESVIEKPFDCTALPNVSLLGNIAPSNLTHGKSPEVVIMYLAFWACSFFELNDCRVPQFQLDRVPLKPDAGFEASR